MKKILFGLGACAMLLSVGACTNSGDNAASQEDKNLGDSISLLLGQNMGGMFADQNKRIQEQDPNGGLDLALFLKGMQSVLDADTTHNLSYLHGQMQALQQIVGMELQLREANIPFNKEALLKGFKEAASDTLFDRAQSQTSMNTLMGRYREKAEEVRKQKALVKKEENDKKAKVYMDSVKKANPGVQTTSSGLQYVIQNPGGDNKVTESSVVKVNYVGKKLDGTVFDDSKGQPREFSVSGVVPGFREGLMLLGEGGKATLYIPGEIAYGEQGAMQAGIEPYEMLVFDVEVVSFNEPQPVAAAPQVSAAPQAAPKDAPEAEQVAKAPKAPKAKKK